MKKFALTLSCSLGFLIADWGMLVMAQTAPLPADPLPANPFEQAEIDIPNEAAVIGLLDQLQSSRFAERRSAAQKIAGMGESAHAALEKAAMSNRPERAIAALDLLRDALNDDDPRRSQSARRCLERIAATQGSAGKIATRAIEQTDQSERLGPPVRPQRPPIPQLGPPPAFAPQGRTNLRISIRNVNGVRKIEVVENDRKFTFQDVNGGLQTERPDGKGGVERKLYKDSDDLKRKDPEAFEKYQKAGGGGIAAGILNLQPRLFGGALPLPMQPRRLPPGTRPAVPQNGQPDNDPLPDGPRIELHPEISPRQVPPPRQPVKADPKRIEV